MRRAIATTFAACVVACSSPAVESADAGPDARDAGRSDARSSDASRGDALPDDARADATPAPVLPAQFWSAPFDSTRTSDADHIPLTIAIDARAESGGTRAVFGANGETARVWLDVVEPGRLVTTANIELPTTLSGSNWCSARSVRLNGCTLDFDDQDGDGIFETLHAVRAVLTLHGWDGGLVSSSADLVAFAEPDVGVPELAVFPLFPRPTDELRLVSSEPLDPSFAPYLEGGGRRVAMTPSSRVSPHSSWSVSLAALPPTTTYVLRADAAVRDLMGNPGTLPAMTLDLAVPPPVEDGTFETSSVGVIAEHGMRTIESDGDSLEGARSVLTEGRTLLSLVIPAGASLIRMLLRFDVEGAATQMMPIVRARTADGEVFSETGYFVTLDEDSLVEGLDRRTAAVVVTVTLAPEPHGTAVLVEIDPRGQNHCALVLEPRLDERVTTTIDAIEAL